MELFRNKFTNIKRLPVGVCLAVVSIGFLVFFSTWRSISLPFVTGYLREILNERFHAYNVDFAEALVQWYPLDDSLVIDFQSVKILDSGDDVIASIPKIQVEVAMSSILDDDIILRSIDIVGPRLTLFRTAGGAFKFDIGYTENGASGEILEDLFVGLAVSSLRRTSLAFPEVKISEGRLFLGDEIAGARIRIPTVNLTLKPHKRGVASSMDVTIAAVNENLQLKADVLYRTSDTVSVVDLTLNEFRPAILSDIVPGLKFMAPFEFPVSGRISGEVDKLLHWNNASFDLKAVGGSLEIAEHIGYNPRLRLVTFRGIYSTLPTTIILDDLNLVLENGKIRSTGVFTERDEKIVITVRSTVSDTSLVSLAPRWFTPLAQEITTTQNQNLLTFDETIVRIEGMYDPSMGKFLGHGTITEGAEQDFKTNEDTIRYSVDGSLSGIPNIVLLRP